jgi:hypothetical protein
MRTIGARAVWPGLLAGWAAVAQAAAGNETNEIPLLVPDEDAPHWAVDRFAGNSTAGQTFFQGMAAEAGGCGRDFSFAVAPDGRAYFLVPDGIAEVSTSGVIRLVVSRQEWRADGLEDLYARGGLLAWNPKANALCFWGNHCIRMLVEKPDGSREIVRVVGSPERPGVADGPAATATLNAVGCFCINSRGTIFFYDGKQYGQRLRKFENGVVTTLSDKMRAGKLVDGPLQEACFNFINLGGLNSMGENDDVLYIGDHWNGVVRRVDLAANAVSTVAGWPKAKDRPLPGGRALGGDGPALTHAGFISGCVFGVYDPVHRAVWAGGPDEGRLRWLRLKDNWVKTIMGVKPGAWQIDGFNNPAESVKMGWCWVLAVDKQGRAYAMNGESPTGYWRLYNRKEVQP